MTCSWTSARRTVVMERMMKRVTRYVIALLAAAASLVASAGTIVYYHNDIAGSPVVATNATGQVLWRESYRPYGERLTNAAASADNKVWFTSRRQDVETGLVYMGARYYDPAMGRFISTDPVGFDEANLHSHNRYAYANNNPFRYKDPDGRVAETIWDLASFTLSVAMFKQDPSLSNFLGAAVDGVALAVPFVPGGVGTIRSIGAAGANATEAITKTVDPKSLLSRQGSDEMSSSLVQRLKKDMAKNGFDAKHAIDAADVDGRLIILDGHHRAQAAAKAGIKEVPVNVHPVTRDQGSQLLREAAEVTLKRD
jgi:RHS repeat-associated protein